MRNSLCQGSIILWVCGPSPWAYPYFFLPLNIHSQIVFELLLENDGDGDEKQNHIKQPVQPK